MDRNIPDRGPAVFALTTGTFALTSCFVGARIICRYGIVRIIGWDDKVMMIAWVIAFFLSFTVDLGVANGLGKRDNDISDDDRATLRRCEYAFSVLYNPALMATKTSVLIFYLRLTKGTQIFLRHVSWATLLVVNLTGIVLTVMNIFLCSPIRAAWTVGVDESATCIPLLTELICAAPVNIITDLAILTVPIPILTRLRLPSRQKMILVVTFALGIFITVVNVIRIYYLQKAIIEVPTSDSSTGPNMRFGDQADFGWYASLSLMWSVVEVNVGLACLCVPTLKPLVLKLLPRVLYDSASAQTYGSSQGSGDLSMPPFRSQTSVTLPAIRNRVSFDFADVRQPKRMLSVNSVESFKFCAIVSILFFLWGVSYGLLDTLNNAVASINHLTTAQSLGLTTAYLGGGYFFGPLLVGQWILRGDTRYRSGGHDITAESIGGFKATFIVGLCIYGIGTIIFWPSAVTNSYGGFLLSSFIVGFGLSVLEVGANSFMILCGPLQYSETRLLLAQGVQGVGSVISSLLAAKVFFKDLIQNDSANGMALINVQWAYLGITLLCVILGLWFFYISLPEVSDHELEQSSNRLPVNPKRNTVTGLQLRTMSLILAVLAQYMYVGAQESGIIYFPRLLTSGLASRNETNRSVGSSTIYKPLVLAISTSDYVLLGRTAFTISRFLMGYLTYVSVAQPRLPRPHTYLALCIASGFLFALLTVVLHTSDPNLLAIPVILYFFSEGPIWPLLFSIGLRGQGLRTKRAAAFLTMGGSGGAFFPFIMYGLVKYGCTVQTAFTVIVGLLVAMAAYPLFLVSSSGAMELVQPWPAVHVPTNQTLASQSVVNRQLDNSKNQNVWGMRSLQSGEQAG
ncbi:MFS transporter [Pochonia chlamydosporia 170]|uniref:MFS transporter n=1 Tax=Pochonia chlamydosporia 170 TaxID=1380566 RepID=A0A179EXB4_METCM|nr:MFS transporter [Pochonia chlamydosporia 170]OAQ57660.1 MFS transporter [Pochonia chlamydosporia 170]